MIARIRSWWKHLAYSWRDYDDALDASHQWGAHDPVIVRVKFRAASGGSTNG